MATEHPSISTVFPGWHVVSVLLPLVTILGSLFVLTTAPNREGQWFPEQLPVALRILHVAAILGLSSAVFALVRRERGGHGPLATLPPFAHIGIATAALIFNLVLALFLIPVWTLK